ncbi:tRNA (N(6)-L-threonylcarbamoyladenosine(37)-C(2))-methylthiotransferase MtaB [Candidatus Acetothermia bacterium]|jgi:threonylcarbamoyladenosine tRNA methylthiotransferase MtaB|nr:tRNA (N(6)-L-threonylcarbamoyladenosine(37)-C(2))-methylthiotransferase MtaB [Candidatus Acetothermia bacterium]MCI2427034.1 tRNA (N(6)-L-threonylcarbamoyladenosine(37)-C(2))-methylthiotransferase MtaB [Candidatus Acetothermia bacterium]MCI2428141.1 tRNA (N(6)-L-threonylcarbamoyladenosine(37)-C(2))-methylthiotransferase MtaB [Candidatus Acetothermia bacterium]
MKEKNYGDYMPRVAFRTLGCRVNQYETQLMREQLELTCRLVDDEADIYVINTCIVTALSERKSRQLISRVRRNCQPVKVLVTGCMAEAMGEEIAKIKGVDIVFDNGLKTEVKRIVDRSLEGEHGYLPASTQTGWQAKTICSQAGRVRAFLKVQDGCNSACSFCRVTKLRGSTQSKPIAIAQREARQLIANGYPEIILTGINLAQYGDDLLSSDLPALIASLLEIDGLRRLRLGSIDPHGITDELVSLFASDSRACPHFHIPLQSGADRILAAMRRGYDTAVYRSRITQIKEMIDDATFGTDLIVGFPGETEDDFTHTCTLIEEIGFVNLHIFRYSPRPGTDAASFSAPVCEREKSKRSKILNDLASKERVRIKSGFLGKKEEILVEGRSRDGRWRGYTRGYIDTHIDAPVHRVGLPDPAKIKPGEFVNLWLTRMQTQTDRNRLQQEFLLGVSEYNRRK